jgi:hypothetical protein
MKTKHTPAPWHVHDGGYNIVSDDGKQLFMNGFSYDDAELEANAQLAAAAPDLLEALIYLTNNAKATMPFLETKEFDAMDVALFKARAAIEKATI